MNLIQIIKEANLKRATVSVFYLRNVFLNWTEIAFGVILGRKELRAVLRGSRTEGYCNLSCVEALTYLALLGYDMTKLRFNDGKLYYGDAEVDQDLISIPLVVCGFVKDRGVWLFPPLNLKFKEVSWSFFEVFCLKDYDIEVKDREVVDVGGGLGDSSIWFAIKGARRVHAFEPLPEAYKVALENVRLNGLDGKVIFYNAGVSSKDGELLVPSTIDVKHSGGYVADNKGSVRVPLYSIDKVRELVKDPYLLKMDCEGCEADIIMNSSLDFEKIVMETHPHITHISNKKLIAKLEEEKYRCESLVKDYRAHKTRDLFYCYKTV